MSIFDLIKSQELTAYWTVLSQDEAPYLGEELFPNQKKLGLELKWIKGANGLPVVLKPSAYDVAAVPRDRIGFDKLSAEMPFFKESVYINEVLRQELNMVLETQNQAYIDSVVNRVFADEVNLLRGARAQRERMRMQALTSGAISIAANGQDYEYDYGVPAANKKTVTKSWSDPTADIVGDIRTMQDEVEDATGTRPSRAICSRATFAYFRKNTDIRNGILGNNSNAPVSDQKIMTYITDELQLSIVIYTKRYVDEAGNTKKFVPDDLFVMFPEGTLGNTWFGTTPEESDLMTSKVANVSITDTGVAVTTIQKADPVNVETKVTMICLPSFEAANQVVILDTTV